MIFILVQEHATKTCSLYIIKAWQQKILVRSSSDQTLRKSDTDRVYDTTFGLLICGSDFCTISCQLQSSQILVI